jgi:hypothetical protein
MAGLALGPILPEDFHITRHIENDNFLWYIRRNKNCLLPKVKRFGEHTLGPTVHPKGYRNLHKSVILPRCSLAKKDIGLLLQSLSRHISLTIFKLKLCRAFCPENHFLSATHTSIKYQESYFLTLLLKHGF